VPPSPGCRRASLRRGQAGLVELSPSDELPVRLQVLVWHDRNGRVAHSEFNRDSDDNRERSLDANAPDVTGDLLVAASEGSG
jgi:hypothetical protein